MPAPPRRTRTYVAFLYDGRRSPDQPLGTVEAPSHYAAWDAARRLWPHAGPSLRIRAAGAAPADLLARALALDGARNPPRGQR
jgi:hypothetical protein